MKSIAAAPRVKVSADGHGVVSHAGMGMLRELADLTGLSAQVTAVLADTYRGPWTYAPGAVFADLAAAVADGADCIDGVGQLCGDREHVFGAKASTTTMWRLVDERIDAAHLPKVRARAGSGAGSGLGGRGRTRRRAGRCTSTSTPPWSSTTPTTRRGGRDLEEDLRPSPAAGVSGPPRDRRRRGAGRAAAHGQRRLEHRRRSHHGPGPGAGLAAGRLAPRPGQSGRTADPGALRLRRRHP